MRQYKDMEIHNNTLFSTPRLTKLILKRVILMCEIKMSSIEKGIS